MSDYHLSDEIRIFGLSHLNSNSEAITSETVFKPGSVVFCQVDQLEEFEKEFLPNVTRKILLLTGKWHLPGLEDSEAVRRIEKHPMVARWFSQNQIFPELMIKPFPYGVNFFSAPAVVRERQRTKLGNRPRSIGFQVPNATIHPHLPSEPLRIRLALQPLMEAPLSHRRYLKNLHRSSYVISPPGDRPDTYRHWECVALGAVPVSNLPDIFRTLFGNAMILRTDLEKVGEASLEPEEGFPNPDLASFCYWDEKIRTEACEIGE